MMMSSSQSIAYLQTLQDPERNNPMAANRDALSRRSTTTLSHKKLKVYKPTPSMLQLHPDLWTVDENLDQMIQRAGKTRDHIVSESEDEDDSDEYGDDEISHTSVPHKEVSHKHSMHGF